MGHVTLDAGPVPPDIVPRQSLCLSQPKPGMLVHAGDDGFKDELLRLYNPDESNAAELLVTLKDTLRKADTDSFWHLLTEGMAALSGAQYAFVSKRILTDDRDVAVEMPPIGEPGACLMGAAFYVNDGHGINAHMNNFKYHAYSCPCAYMKHDKIFIIPDKLNDFIINNPNELVVPGEAYLGLPLFADGKCFAHFGVMWSPEGASRRRLGWGYLEMLFHSLEDLILDRVLEQKNFANAAQPAKPDGKVVPHEAITMAQSLKPYARSLSHELRTPMQGVVGMLDVIMANVKEAAEDSHHEPRIRKLLDTLKENIEAVQDSSRRVVEAADNVVHAYDMNMGLPETPITPLDRDFSSFNVFLRESRAEYGAGEDPLSQHRGMKRKRDDVSAWSRQVRVARSARQRARPSTADSASKNASAGPRERAVETQERCSSLGTPDDLYRTGTTGYATVAPESSATHDLRHIDLRAVIQHVITDALKVGGRPDSAIAEETELGEKIEVRTRRSNGEAHTKTIEWMVSPDVPDMILVDERDLAKMVSCLVLNAIKFTDDGSITLKATLSVNSRYIVINVKDTGSGIPAAFLPNLFKPFSREDVSTTRESEGLGLGLLVAKGLARKLGGDLFCLKSHVFGPERGSEFEMRVPLTPGEICSRPVSPYGSPTPCAKTQLSAKASEPKVVQHPPTPPSLSKPFEVVVGETVSPEPVKGGLGVHHIGLPSPRSASPARPFIEDRKQFAQRYPLNVLIVDDNRINRRVLRQMLENYGYKNIHESYDGQDAVDKMRSSAQWAPEDAINVILMDIWMPHLDGFQATEAILQLDELAHKPQVFAVSADITDSAVDRAGEVGMRGFVPKPFVAKDIQRLIMQHFSAVAGTGGEEVF